MSSNCTSSIYLSTRNQPVLKVPNMSSNSNSPNKETKSWTKCLHGSGHSIMTCELYYPAVTTWQAGPVARLHFLFGKQFAQSGLHLSLGLTKRRWRTAFERQTHWFVIPFRCEISSSMGDLTYLKNPKINSLCLLPPSHWVLATSLSYMFLKFICVLTGNKNDRKFLSDWVAQQDFSMTNEFFSLPQSFIIKAIVSPGRCTCAFKNCITFFPCTLQQTQLNSKHLWRLRKLVSAISW